MHQRRLLGKTALQCPEQCTEPPTHERSYSAGPWYNSVIIESHRVIFCVAPKAGSVAWRQVFLRMSGSPDWRSPYPFFIRGRPRLQILDRGNMHFMGNDNWTRIAIIREPAIRLYSTFVDKVKNGAASPAHLAQLRQQLNLSAVQGLSNKAQLAQLDFHDFVTRVGRTLRSTRGGAVNMHWAPQHDTCGPKSGSTGRRYEVYVTPEQTGEQQNLLDCVLKSIASRSPNPEAVLRLNDTFALTSMSVSNHQAAPNETGRTKRSFVNTFSAAAHTHHAASSAAAAYTPALLAEVKHMYALDYAEFFLGSCAARQLHAPPALPSVTSVTRSVRPMPNGSWR